MSQSLVVAIRATYVESNVRLAPLQTGTCVWDHCPPFARVWWLVCLNRCGTFWPAADGDTTPSGTVNSLQPLVASQTPRPTLPSLHRLVGLFSPHANTYARPCLHARRAQLYTRMPYRRSGAPTCLVYEYGKRRKKLMRSHCLKRDFRETSVTSFLQTLHDSIIVCMH
jgi:hypothetical protein